MFRKNTFGGKYYIKIKNPRVNHQIRAEEVRLVDECGKQIGIMKREEALNIARERELDLIEIVPNANPPICKLMEYDKYRYELRKKEKEIKKKQRVTQLKEIRLRPLIEEHDYQIKLEHIKNFLLAKNKVRVTIRFSGREVLHLELGKNLIDKIKNDLIDIGIPETEKIIENKLIILTLSPKHHSHS